jgi:hypothetical protein
MNTTSTAKTFSSIGCIIDCNHNSSDDLALEILEFASTFGYVYDEFAGSTMDFSDYLYETSEDAVMWLNENVQLPPFCYFIVEDNSLFITPDIEGVREDDDVVTCEDTPSYVLQVNERGNTTLYRVTLEEVWGVC